MVVSSYGRTLDNYYTFSQNIRASGNEIYVSCTVVTSIVLISPVIDAFQIPKKAQQSSLVMNFSCETYQTLLLVSSVKLMNHECKLL